MGLNISPSIWTIIYRHVILDCLQSRKYCKAIMDDLLLFTPVKKSHIAKLEDLLKVHYLKMDQRYHLRSVSILERNYNISEILYRWVPIIPNSF